MIFYGSFIYGTIDFLYGTQMFSPKRKWKQKFSGIPSFFFKREGPSCMFSQNDNFSQKSGENQRKKISRWYPLAPFTVNWLSFAMKYTRFNLHTDMCAQTDYDTSLYDHIVLSTGIGRYTHSRILLILHIVLLITLSIMKIVVVCQCPRQGVTVAVIFWTRGFF